MSRLLCWLGLHRWGEMKVTPISAGDFLLVRNGLVFSEPPHESYMETVCYRCGKYRDRPDFGPVWIGR